MYLPSLIFETMTIKRYMCEHNGVLKFIIRHLYPCEMKKETRRHNSLQNPAETRIKNSRSLDVI